MTQLSLPFFQQDDNRPLPEIIATGGDNWQPFPLPPTDHDGQRYYPVQDWICGIAQSSDTRAASELWRALKRRLAKANIQMRTWCTTLPYKATDGKTYQRDFATAEGLYMITQRMAKDTGVRDKILAFLAAAGVFADEARREPEKAVAALLSYSDRQYAKYLKEWGYSDTEIKAKLTERREVIEVRLEFQDVLFMVTDGAGNFAIVTNAEYRGLFGRDAKTIKAQTGAPSARAGIHPIGQTFCKLAEMSCTEAYRQRGKLSPDDAILIMTEIAGSLGQSVKLVQKQVGIDVVTGKPLLTGGAS